MTKAYSQKKLNKKSKTKSKLNLKNKPELGLETNNKLAQKKDHRSGLKSDKRLPLKSVKKSVPKPGQKSRSKSISRIGTKSRGLLFRGIAQMLTMQGAFAKAGRHIRAEDLSKIERAAMLVQDGRIVWLGEEKKLPKNLLKQIDQDVDLKQETVLPGFVECHTHSLFAGHRAHEFEQRLRGVSYQEIAKQGGGILSTVRATRAASDNQLTQTLQQNLDRFVAQGVTTVEVKTGYGLNQESEVKMLKVISSLAKKQMAAGVRVIPTFLGAHALGPEFENVEAYLQSLLSYLPQLRRLTSRVDIWVEKGFFEMPLARRYLQKAKELGFSVLIHADQLSLCGGAELAVELSALSADHVIQVGPNEIKKLAQSEVTAVLLPMADLYMKCAYPPARQMIDAGVRVALATDFNPGSCPSQDISLVGLLARLTMQMTLPEVVAAYTVGAAYALGEQNQAGVLAVGRSADFVTSALQPDELFYSAGKSQVSEVYVAGNRVFPLIKK